MPIPSRGGWASPGPLGVAGRLVPGIVLAWAIATGPASVSAHDGSARLIVEPDRVNPGGVVTVRGEDLGADVDMAVALAGETGRAALTSVTSDAQGHFSVAVQIPVDAPLGVYALEAVAESGAGLKAVLVVEGLPIVDGDGGPRGQDEPLLVVLPADWQRSLAAPVAPLPPFVAPPHQPPAVPPDGANLVPWVALVGAIPVLAILFWGLRQRRDLPDGPAELP